ncbi:MAG: hypothetical protein AAB971_01960, partial [Patescibacteria group bacterium]
RHDIKPLGYLRYGDDFILFVDNREQAIAVQKVASIWLLDSLSLRIHPKNDVLARASQGLKFLGHQIYPTSGITINKTMSKKINQRINKQNAGSYKSMHLTTKQARQLPWLLNDIH